MNQKRNSRGKLNGQILLLQNDLMSKLASISNDNKAVDQLGFQVLCSIEQPDALTNLINRSKNIVKNHLLQTQNNKSKIDFVRNKEKDNRSRKQSQGTFLTGVGVCRQNEQNSIQQISQPLTTRKQYDAWDIQDKSAESDPNQILKQLILKNNNDDLAELRKMIKKTGQSLEDYSKKFNKSKKSILQIAEKYSGEMKMGTLDRMMNYRQFQAKQLDEADVGPSYEYYQSRKIKSKY